jgi:tRNA-dihydrouridine synthase 1
MAFTSLISYHRDMIANNCDVPTFGVAPMIAQSELAFRTLVRRHSEEFLIGASVNCRFRFGLTTPLITWTPMLDTEHVLNDVSGDDYLRETVALSGEDCACLVQIGGPSGDVLARSIDAVERVLGADATKTIGFDLNLGCPQPFAELKCIGAFLALDVERTRACVASMAARATRLQLMLTTKIRIHQRVEHSLALIEAMVDAGSRLVTVHGRTWQQNRGGAADWSVVRALCGASRVPTLNNGGVRCAADIDRALAGNQSEQHLVSFVVCVSMFIVIRLL